MDAFIPQCLAYFVSFIALGDGVTAVNKQAKASLSWSSLSVSIAASSLCTLAPILCPLLFGIDCLLSQLRPTLHLRPVSHPLLPSQGICSCGYALCAQFVLLYRMISNN